MITAEELQRIWDEEVVYSWTKFGKVKFVIYGFIERTSPILYKLRDIRRMVKWIATLNLKRCPWYLIDGESTTYPWYCQTRAFVNSFSPQMTGALYSDKIDNNDIIDKIDNFKWHVKAIKDNQRNRETVNELNRKKATRYISARAGDKKHDWGTVK